MPELLTPSPPRRFTAALSDKQPRSERARKFWPTDPALSMQRKTVVVRDKMQRGYRYALSVPSGRNFIRNSSLS